MLENGQTDPDYLVGIGMGFSTREVTIHVIQQEVNVFVDKK